MSVLGNNLSSDGECMDVAEHIHENKNESRRFDATVMRLV